MSAVLSRRLGKLCHHQENAKLSIANRRLQLWDHPLNSSMTCLHFLTAFS